MRIGNTDPDQTLVQAGPFTVKASCGLNAGQNTYSVYATTDIVGNNTRNTDLDIGSRLTISGSQESGTPPPPNGPFPMSAYLWSASGTTVTLQLAQGGHLFSDNTSNRVQCTYSGFAVVG